MMATKMGDPFEFTKATPAMRRNVFNKTDAEKAAELNRKNSQKQGGVADQLCRVEDKLDRILSILNSGDNK